MADIKLKNYLGESKPYSGVPKVWLESADSTEENRILFPFAYGEPVSAKVEPNFSAGDMAVEIPEGELISELTIKKPPALVPANIAEGVDIAGIIGTLIAGSGGGTSGQIQMKTGTYKPPSAPRVLYANIGTYNGFQINSKGFWQKTITTEEFVPVAERRYYTKYIDYAYETAKAHSSFSTYGKCVTLGNCAIATGKQEDISSREFLIIYQVNQKKLIIMATVSGTKYISNGETWQSPNMYIWDIEDCMGGFEIEHGGTSVPDAAFVIQTQAVVESPKGNVQAAWAVHSKLAHMMKNNIVSGTVGTLNSVSANKPLENTYNDMSLYCPDQYTVAFSKNAEYVVFSPGYDCWWFAIWGLTNTSE